MCDVMYSSNELTSFCKVCVMLVCQHQYGSLKECQDKCWVRWLLYLQSTFFKVELGQSHRLSCSSGSFVMLLPLALHRYRAVCLYLYICQTNWGGSDMGEVWRQVGLHAEGSPIAIINSLKA